MNPWEMNWAKPTPSVDAALKAEGIDGRTADVVRSIYAQESGSGANTKTSNAGAVGGMQITPATFRSVADPDWKIEDPEHNLRAGIRYVKQMSDLAGGDPKLAAAGYYGGPGAIDKARQGIAVSDPRNPKAPNTLQYADQVAARLPADTDGGGDSSAAPDAGPAADSGPPPWEMKWADPAKQDLPSGTKPSAAGAGRGKVNPPSDGPPPAPRSIPESLARQVGLTVRAGAKGLASVPGIAVDAVTGPVNAAADAIAGKGVGPRFPTTVAAVDNALTMAGLPQPENPTERVVQDVASGMASAGGSVALSNVAAKAASPVVAAVGKQMAEGAGLQTISAGTGAGAEGITREKGGSPAAQAAAGVLGALAPVGASAAWNAALPTRGSKQLGQVAQKANDAGFVIPPPDLNGGFISEGVNAAGGKIKTAQAASQRNQAVTNKLVRQALDLPEDAPLDQSALAAIRQDAAKSYQDVAGAGTITPTPDYTKALDDAVAPYLAQAKSFPDRKVPPIVAEIQSLKTTAFDAGDAVATIRVLRSEADTAFRHGDNLAGGALKKAAGALEDQIQTHLENSGAAGQDMLGAYRAARQKIAQTYTVEAALNPQNGNVDAQVLARALKKGTPLSGDLRTVAEVAQAFPKATQALKESPKQLSVTDLAAGMAAGFQNPWLASIPLVRPVARSIALSGPVQRQAVKQAGQSQLQQVDGVVPSAIDSLRQGTTPAAPPVGAPSPGTPSSASAAPPALQPPGPELAPWLQQWAQPSPEVAAAVGAAPAASDASSPAAVPVAPAEVPPAAPAASPLPLQPSKIDQLREAGEHAAADHLQTIADRDAARANAATELVGMHAQAPDLPIHGKPVFTDAYRDLRMAGTPPAEAAGRASMEAFMRSLGPQNGLPPKAIDAVLAKARAMPLADVPGFVVRFAQELAQKGVAQPLQDPAHVENTIAALRDHAMGAVIGHVYGGARADEPAGAAAPGLEQVASAAPAAPEQPAAPSPAAIEVDQAAHTAATSPLNDHPEPTEKQALAGNYKMGHVRIHGMDISIENPQGSTRKGVDPDGTPWESQLASHYGYIKNSVGNDGDHLDVFIGPDPESRKVFVVDQVNKDGSFDEHKAIMGAHTAEEAKAIYAANYPEDWKGMAHITELPIAAFKAWAKSGHLKEPLGETTAKADTAAAGSAPAEIPARDGAPAGVHTGADGADGSRLEAQQPDAALKLADRAQSIPERVVVGKSEAEKARELLEKSA